MALAAFEAAITAGDVEAVTKALDDGQNVNERFGVSTSSKLAPRRQASKHRRPSTGGRSAVRPELQLIANHGRGRRRSRQAGVLDLAGGALMTGGSTVHPGKADSWITDKDQQHTPSKVLLRRLQVRPCGAVWLIGRCVIAGWAHRADYSRLEWPHGCGAAPRRPRRRH